MNPRIPIVALCAAALAAACTDAPQTTSPAAPSPAVSSNIKVHGGENYVAIGTSISMGWASNGVYAGSQLVSFPAQLRFGSSPQISLPLIESPGCTPPLVVPLGSGLRLSGESAAPSSVCAPNINGVVLPTQNLGIAAALTIDALTRTPGGTSDLWYPRVLPPGMTQVGAALSQNPTLLSIEFGANEVLKTSSGRVVENETYLSFPLFAQAYDALVGIVGSAEVPRVLLVGFLTQPTNLPALRRGDEIWADRAEFAALHVDVDPNCDGNANYINVSVQALTLVFTAAFTSTHGLPNPVFSCADIPGAEDEIVTPQDIATINALLAQMAEHTRQLALDNHYAFFSLDELYSRADLKPPVYSVISQLTSLTPYGPYISADGMHPSAAGHSVLALAAAHALNKTYSGISAHIDDEAIPLAVRLVEPMTPSMALAWAKRVAAEHQGVRMPTCLLPGGCSVRSTPRLR